MIKCLGFFLIFGSYLLSISASAQVEPIPIGCVSIYYACSAPPDETNKCPWLYDIGTVLSIDLHKVGNGPSYEVWQGKLDGKMYGQYKYTVSVYQRREANQTISYVTTDLWVHGAQITATGENSAEVRHLALPSNVGIGIRCSIDIEPVRGS